jgi:hypothetical protein
MTTAVEKPAKVTEATRFDYEGEVKEIAPEIGFTLVAKYRQAAAALAAAKAAAFAIEEEIKTVMGGHERLVVDGTVVANYVWKDLTSFNKKALKEKYPAIVAEFTETKKNGSRAFSVPGTAGVE